MATIVLHKESNKKYVLIGTGYGAYMAASPSFWGGNLLPNEETGEIPVAAVSDGNGLIHWFLTEDLQVLEVDGIRISNLLDKWEDEDPNMTESLSASTEIEQCPACHTRVAVDMGECPSCGLTLISSESEQV